MIIKNSTSYPDAFLRRMCGWIRAKLDMPEIWIAEAAFRNRSDRSYSGHAWWWQRRVVISTGRQQPRRAMTPEEYDEERFHILRRRLLPLVGEFSNMTPEEYAVQDRVHKIMSLARLDHNFNNPPDPAAELARENTRRLHDLVATTAHEFEHVNRHRLEAAGKLAKTRRGGRSGGGSEFLVEHEAQRVLRLFLADAARLEQQWRAAPVASAACRPK